MGRENWSKRYSDAVDAEKKAEAEQRAIIFEECCFGNPFVTDDEGNWLTKEQVAERLRQSWKEE